MARDLGVDDAPAEPAPGSLVADVPDTVADLRAEVERLRAALLRETRQREAASEVGVTSSRELADVSEELARLRNDILVSGERDRVIASLDRAVRRQVELPAVVEAVVHGLGAVVDADAVLMYAFPDGIGDGRVASWTRLADPPVVRLWPELPRSVRAVVELRGLAGETLVVGDVDHDPVVGLLAAELRAAWGCESLVATPVSIGHAVAGWIILLSSMPRQWPREVIELVQRHAVDVATVLAQVQAFEQQRVALARSRELDRVKDSFVATVSHELRTPLTSIRGYLETLLDGDLGDLDLGTEQALHVVARNAERLSDLVEDLLTLSQIDEQDTRVRPVPTDLVRVVETGRRTIAPLVLTRDLVCEVVLEGSPPRAMADAAQLERVVVELLTNAVKFTPDGGRVELRLRELVTPQGRWMVELVVSDTGLGIPAEEQERLFDRFFRSSVAREREIQGTGLGLVIARAVIEAHDGSLTVESARDAGTTVRVGLPAV